MKKRIASILTIACILCLFGCATGQQKNETQGSYTEQETIFESAENQSVETTEKRTEPKETVDLSEIPGGTRFVVDIWDKTKEEQIACDQILEKFWEDATAEYYFECVKSQYIFVMDNTGGTVDLVTALNAGFITIDTLDSYGITYITVPKP